MAENATMRGSQSRTVGRYGDRQLDWPRLEQLVTDSVYPHCFERDRRRRDNAPLTAEGGDRRWINGYA